MSIETIWVQAQKASFVCAVSVLCGLHCNYVTLFFWQLLNLCGVLLIAETSDTQEPQIVLL